MVTFRSENFFLFLFFFWDRLRWENITPKFCSCTPKNCGLAAWLFFGREVLQIRSAQKKCDAAHSSKTLGPLLWTVYRCLKLCTCCKSNYIEYRSVVERIERLLLKQQTWIWFPVDQVKPKTIIIGICSSLLISRSAMKRKTVKILPCVRDRWTSDSLTRNRNVRALSPGQRNLANTAAITIADKNTFHLSSVYLSCSIFRRSLFSTVGFQF